MSTSSRPSSPHRRDIQGLRGLAVLLVVAFHSGTFVRGGFIGVDVFFVISGFVITASLARELARTGSIDLRSFYVRRVRRLLPALALVVVATLALSVSALDPAGGRQAAADTARSAALFVANLHLETNGGGYFAPAAERNPLLHTWSLSIEEQFYAVLPVLLLGSWVLGRRRRDPFGGLKLAVVALSLGSFAWATQAVLAGDVRRAFYLPHLRAWEFGVGALLALNAHRLAGMRPRRCAALAGTGALLVVGSALVLSDAVTFPGPSALPSVVGTAMLIAGGTAGGRAGARLGLTAPWIVWLGDRSYSWYLWHWPLLTFAFVEWPDVGWARLAASAVALVPAAVSYSLVERPIRADRRVVGVAALTLAGIAVVLPVSSSLVVEQEADAELARRSPELGDLTDVWVNECDDLPWPAERCTFGPPDAGGTIALIGDSHASVLGDVVTLVGEQLGLRTVAMTKAGCAASMQPTDFGSGDCPAWQRATVERLAEIDPDVIVVANRSPLYVYGRVEAADDALVGRQPIAPDPDAALGLWGEGLRELLDALDTPTLVVQSVPEQPGSVAALIGTDIDEPLIDPLTISAHLDRSGAVGRVESDVVAGIAEAVVFDPASVLCGDTCPARVDGEWRYFDGNHLTPRASLLLADPLRSQLRRLLSGELSGDNR